MDNSDYVFIAVMVNAEEYNSGGKFRSCRLFLPADKETITEAFKSIGLPENVKKGDYLFDDYHLYSEKLHGIFKQEEDIYEINFLASVIADMDRNEVFQFKSEIEKSTDIKTIAELIMLAHKANTPDKMYDASQIENYSKNIFLPVISAVRSNYDGYTAFVGKDNKVYLGKSENYLFHQTEHNTPVYINTDNSLLFISDNENMYSFLYGEGWISTQKKMIDEGVFTDKDYAEFDELQRGVLAGLERTAIIRFDGVPFTYPDYERIEQNPKEWDYKSRDAEALAEELDNYFRKTDHNYAEVFPNADEKKMRFYDALMEGHFIGIKNLLSDMGVSESGYLQRRVTAHEINYPMDLYVVYQLKPDLGLENLHYQTISGIRSMGKTIDKENYTPVYSAELTYDKTFTNIVAELYYNRPSDFYGRPLNVSDVIVLKKNGQEQAFYYDIAGFVSIPEFLESRKKTEQIKEKPSIRKQLADNKAKAADIPKHTKQKNKDLEV